MIDFDEAQARVLALAANLPGEIVPLAEATGRWAAADIAAKRTQPARDLSAMDGYAVRFADLPGPWRVVGESAAGRWHDGAVGAGEAVRIFTGAALPAGTDTIVVHEEAARDVDALSLTGDGPAQHGSSVRCAASDFVEGAVVVAKGDLLNPAAIALVAMSGHGEVTVTRRVRVALVSTGLELVPAGVPCPDDRLPDSNRAMLTAMLGALPVDIVDLGIVPDDMAQLTSVFERACDCDLIVSSGGASVGDHDLVRPTLLALGANLDFWKIAMRPGKPLMAGTLRNAVVIGLPGNPVSAFVTATLFVKPLIAALAGASQPRPPRVTTTVAHPMPAVGPRTDFVRARWSAGALQPLPSGDSGTLSHLAHADVLIVREACAPAISANARVEAILLA